MQINVDTVGNTVNIRLNGRFNFDSHREFRSAYDPHLNNTAVANIDIDLSKVDYLDSSALGMLLMLRERAQAASKKLTLSKPSQNVAQILDIANFAKLFEIKS
ncbi:MAG TPA: STAS domain-containing protein [Gallionellaceae bacterium]|nr:STAS domain-containing protein [Gallionellaceae bacterium]